MALTRRHLLASAGALGALGAVATAAVGLGYRAWWDQPAAPGLRYLSTDEAAFVDALADAIFPPSEALPLRGREAAVALFMDQTLGGMAPVQRNLVRLSMHALDQYPRTSGQRAFRDLALDEAIAVLGEWTRSELAELRGVVASVYVFVAMAYTVHPEVASRLAPSFRCGYGQ